MATDRVTKTQKIDVPRQEMLLAGLHLTERQRRFAVEYDACGNGAEAARRAGYAVKRADAIATENLRKPVVSEAIRRLTTDRWERLGKDNDRTLLELRRLAFGRLTDVAEWDESGEVKIRASASLSADDAAAIREISETVDGKGRRHLRIKMHDKLRALDMLAKSAGLYEDEQSAPPPLAPSTTINIAVDAREMQLKDLSEEERHKLAREIIARRARAEAAAEDER